MEFSFVWSIENFSGSLEQNKVALTSPSFTLEETEQTRWHLLLYPRGVEDERDISFYLHRQDGDAGPEIATIDYELAFLGENNFPEVKVEIKDHAFKKGHGFGVASFLFRDDIFKKFRDTFLPEDTLSVRCRIWSSSGYNIVGGECRAYTRIGVQKGCFIWEIPDFSSFQLNEDRTIVVAPESEKYPTLTMRLFLTGEYQRDRKLEIEIAATGVDKPNVSTIKISVLNAYKMALDSTEDEHLFSVDAGKQVWRFPCFLTKNQLISNKRLYLPNDVLTLKCEATVSIGVEMNKVERTNYKRHLVLRNSETFEASENGEDSTADVQVTRDLKMLQIKSRKFPEQPNPAPVSLGFQSDFQSLYEDGVLSDLTLRAGGETFPVHKAILSARSPVFKAMFGSDMLESVSDILDIADMNAETMHGMLIYAYTDTLPEMDWDGFIKLYFAADKYEIQSLKEKCSKYLLFNLNASNVPDILLLADMHQDNILKEATHNFILNVDNDVFRSSEWKTFETQYLNLAFETMRSIYLKKYLS